MARSKSPERPSGLLARTGELVRAIWRKIKRGVKRAASFARKATSKVVAKVAAVTKTVQHRARAILSKCKRVAVVTATWTRFLAKATLSFVIYTLASLLDHFGHGLRVTGAMLGRVAAWGVTLSLALLIGREAANQISLGIDEGDYSGIHTVEKEEPRYSTGFSEETIARTKLRDEHLDTAGAYLYGALTETEGEYEVAAAFPVNDLRARYDMSDEPTHEFPFQSGSLEEQLDLYHTVMHAGYAAKETAWWTGRYHACKLVMEHGDDKVHQKMWGYFSYLHRECKGTMSSGELSALRAGYQSFMEERQRVLHS